MSGRKNTGRPSPLVLVLLALGFFFATYNLLTLAISYKASWASDELNAVDANTGVQSTDLKYHVALTATDAPYSQWQSRIMYYWYKKVKDMPGSDMGKFTRILHSGKPDKLMEEIPSFVVDPLPGGLDRVRIFKFAVSVSLIFCLFMFQYLENTIACKVLHIFSWKIVHHMCSLFPFSSVSSPNTLLVLLI